MGEIGRRSQILDQKSAVFANFIADAAEQGSKVGGVRFGAVRISEAVVNIRFAPVRTGQDSRAAFAYRERQVVIVAGVAVNVV